MEKTVFLFPGQGSQSVGMGQDIYQEFDFVRELFDMAEEVTKINLSRLCFKGPMTELTRTVNLQPAIMIVSLSFLTILEKEGFLPDTAAGHSLGEYGALATAEIVSKNDAMRLIHMRGQLMHRESTRHDGAMHAIIGLGIDTVRKLVKQVQKEGIVSVANHNTQQQIVITGSPDPVAKVSSLAAAKGAKSIPLKVSGAWHSELIKGAEEEFQKFLKTFSFQPPKLPVVHNYTADFSPSDTSEIKNIMLKQLCNPVKWYDSVCLLMDHKIKNFVEIGPGKVLTGLVKKIMPRQYAGNTFFINNLKTLENFLNAVS